jgi:hypothetical protein
MSAPIPLHPLKGISDILYRVGVDFIRLLPDGFIYGVAFLSIITFCKSYGVLLASMVELMLIQRLIGSVIGGISPISGGKDSRKTVCETGFMFKNLSRVSLVETLGRPSYFPSPSMFFIAGTLSYMVSSVQEFSKEITMLGGEMSTRKYFTGAMSLIFLILVLAFKLSYGCEEFGPLLMSLIFGLIIGYVIMEQNKRLFGRATVNILNLPMIQSMQNSGKPMYVCGATN